MQREGSGSGLRRLLLLLPLLLLVAVAVNWKPISAIARGEKTFKSVLMGKMIDPNAGLENWTMPADIGADDAKVVVEVLLRQGDPCHVDMVYFGQSIGTVEPARIRVDFVDTATEAGQKRFTELKLGCEQGMAINGKTKFKLPAAKTPAPSATGPDSPSASDAAALADAEPADSGHPRPVPAESAKPGKERTLYLTADGGWGLPDLWLMLDTELKAAYKDKGMRMAADAFEIQVNVKKEEFREKLKEEMKALKEAEKG